MYITWKKVSVLLMALLLIVISIPAMVFAESPDAAAMEIVVPNTPIKGMIQLEKKGPVLTGFMEQQDSYGNTIHTPVYTDGYLEGAEFEIRAVEDIVGKDGTVWYKAGELADTIITGKQMTCSKALPLGHYYLTEISAPAGYSFDGSRQDVVLAANDHTTPVVKVNVHAANDYMPVSVSLSKQKEVILTSSTRDGAVTSNLGIAPGDGFVFGLYNSIAIKYGDEVLPEDTLIDTGVTDSNGNLTFAGDYPHGEYYLKELYAPEGWQIDQSLHMIVISDDFKTERNEVVVALESPILNHLIQTEVLMSKTDITGSDYLPNTLIEVCSADGEVVARGNTGEDGYLPGFHVVPGEYVYREVYAPEGYELYTEEMTFTVNADGEIEGTTNVADDFSRVSVLKVDENHRPLASVEFGLYTGDGKLVMTAVSNEEGLTVFEMIPFGNYFIQEKTPLPGYLRDYTRIPVKVDGTFVNPAAPLGTIENCPSEILLQKVDQVNAELPGAEFGLYDADGRLVMTTVSDEKGLIRFTHVPIGTYTIREMKAPDGYLLNKKTVSVTIKDGYTNPEKPQAVLMDHLKKIVCKKVDTSGQPIAGVEFSLINAATGEVAETAVSDKNGVFYLTKFDFGDWIIRETAAPAGYVRMEDKLFHVGDDWKAPEPYVFTNIPNHYEFMKVDTSGMPMAGVKFHLEDAQGKVLGTLVSGKDGIVHADGLERGTYFIREIETLEGFHVTGEVIKVTVDERFKVSENLRKLVNYTEIQTGVNMAVTAVMWVGIAMVLASGVLGFLRMKKKKAGNQN